MPAELLAAGVVINIAAMLFMQQTARRHEADRVRHAHELEARAVRGVRTRPDGRGDGRTG